MSITYIFGLLALLGCAHGTVYDTRFKGVTWDDATWTIRTTNLDQGHYQSRMSLANGYFGINVAALGPFFEVDSPVAGDAISGWPLFDRRQTFATIAGFYDSQPTTNGTNFQWLLQYGGESVISGVPHWAGLHVEVGNDVLTASTPASQISNFQSSLEIQNGLLTWAYTWTPSSGAAIDIEYSAFVHKLYLNQAAVQLTMTSKTNQTVTVIDVLNGDCAVRSDAVGSGYVKNQTTIWSAVSPHWLYDIHGYIYSTMIGDSSTNMASRSQYSTKSIIGGNSSSIAQAIKVGLRADAPASVAKFVGAASSDAFIDPEAVASGASAAASAQGYQALLASHSAEWQSIMTSDSVEDYSDPTTGLLPDDPDVIELSITAVTNPYHLLQNTIGTNALGEVANTSAIDVNSIAVGGLGSDSYAGWIFWDAEVWMAPGLVAAFPEAAKGIPAYRVSKFAEAQKNMKTAYQSSKNKTDFSEGSAVFPWVSGRFGNCTAAGPCFDYEYHLNGDIGLEIYNYFVATGDSVYFENDLLPIYDGTAQLYADILKKNRTDGTYWLYNATDPDEYANFETNVGYTMVLAQTHINQANVLRERFGLAPNTTWTDIASQIHIPIDEEAGLVLEYQTMNGIVEVKQADVVLVDDFLDWKNPYTYTDLEFYAGRQSLAGPGMTYGVFSIVENAAAASGCGAYTYDLYSSQPYARAPWFQFSEQLLDNFQANGGTHPAYPFLTGHGGAYRVPVFGYLGLHFMLDSLNINPNIPPQIQNLSYRTIYWQGWPIKAVSNQTHTTLTRLGESLSTANSTFAGAAIPVTIGLDGQYLSNSTVYNLEPMGSITVPNRQIGYVKTVPGNIAQCMPVTSSQAYEPGQFPLSAVDGALSTKWQPSQLSIKSSMTVQLSEPFVPVTQIRFDWAQSPPASYKVTFSNSSDEADAVDVTNSSSIKISNPYVARKAAMVLPYSSNTTNVTLGMPVYSGRYATLTIQGNQALAGTSLAKNGTGASVAEFAIVAANGTDLMKRNYGRALL